MKKWETLYKVESSELKVQSLNIEYIIKILLENRGLKTQKEIDEFLHPVLEKVTIETVEIDKKQLAKAIKRIQNAIFNNEKIIIFGDYDVDGVCGTTILWESLYKAYKNVFPYIPHRVDEGYGLSNKGIDSLLEKYPDAKLIITVDNGVVASEAVSYAKEKGLDVIITDHHVGANEFPDAYAIVHTTKLCGAGVAYMLSHELKVKSEKLKVDQDGLELVALATIADLVPLIGANRTFVKYGLENLKKTKRVGLLELLKEAGIQKDKIGVYEVGHIIGPRINAMGRLFHAMDSLRLLCTKDLQKAMDFATKLGVTNKERQALTLESAQHAKSILASTIQSSKIAFVAHADYNPGVIGLIASKLVEEYYRPSFAISIGNPHSKGSARSISGINIIELIRSVSHTIIQAGGHPMAAGFTVETNRIEEFRIALEKKASELITDDHLIRKIKIDVEIDLSIATFEFYKRLQELSPFGIGNSEPTFASREVTVEDMKVIGRDKTHLKLKVSQKKSGVFDAIAFSMAEKASEMKIGDTIDIAYVIDLNEWNGSKKLQLKIKDLKRSIEN